MVVLLNLLCNYPGGTMSVVERRVAVDPRISIVIPAKNEARNLRLVLPELPQVHEVILVDGGSSDGTIEAAQKALPDTRVIQQTRRGKGNALACGFRAATGDIIVMFDADGSANPAEIPAFVEALVRGADFAKGSRFRLGGGSHDITRFRSTGNRGLNWLANLVLKTKYTDLCYGYNAFWADILEELDLPNPDATAASPDAMMWGDGFEIETVLNCRIASANLVVEEVGSIERSRIYGVSNLNAIRDGFRVLKTILKERSARRRLAAGLVDVRELEDVVEDIAEAGVEDVVEEAAAHGSVKPVLRPESTGSPASDSARATTGLGQQPVEEIL